MTDTPPLPAAGGSYIRNADGSLTEITAEVENPAAVAPIDEAEVETPTTATPKPTAKRAVKAPAEEG